MYSQPNKPQSETVLSREVALHTRLGTPITFKEKKCKFCGDTFTPMAPSHQYCCQDCADNGWSQKYIKRVYSMTFEEWTCMFEKAEGKCEICGSRGFKLNPNSQLMLVVDHDHTTGKIRGMLCHNCNRALGLLQDSDKVLTKAIEYLRGATTRE